MPYAFATAVVGFLGAIVLGSVAIVRQRPLANWMRAVLVVCLIVPIPFCAFGLAASFEGGRGSWIAAVVYLAIILGCLAGAITSAIALATSR